MNNEMFNNMMSNSIGNDKRCKKEFKIKKVIMKIALPVIIGIAMATSLTGCFFNYTPDNRVVEAVSEMGKISDNYPFDLGDVRMYEMKNQDYIICLTKKELQNLMGNMV